jgi:PBP1b-binding outer membrane lipoprotein LpoB
MKINKIFILLTLIFFIGCSDKPDGLLEQKMTDSGDTAPYKKIDSDTLPLIDKQKLREKAAEEYKRLSEDLLEEYPEEQNVQQEQKLDNNNTNE